MKSRADKFIARKLNSLDTLPEGYQPNLEAKWAIIHEATATKKAGNKFWIGIAASVLIFILAGMFVINRNEKIIAGRNNENVKQPVSEQRAVTMNPITAEAAGKIVPVKNDKAKRIRHAIENSDQSGKQETPIDNPAAEKYFSDNEEVHDPSPAAADAADKSRYFQMDFDDPVKPTVKTPDNFAQAVRFRIDLGKTDRDESGQTTGAFRIKQNF